MALKLTDEQASKHCNMSVQEFRQMVDQGLGPRLLLNCSKELRNGATRRWYYKAALDLWMEQRQRRGSYE